MSSVSNELKGRIALWITLNQSVDDPCEALDKFIKYSNKSKHMLYQNEIDNAKIYFNKWYSKAERDLRISQF